MGAFGAEPPPAVGWAPSAPNLHLRWDGRLRRRTSTCGGMGAFGAEPPPAVGWAPSAPNLHLRWDGRLRRRTSTCGGMGAFGAIPPLAAGHSRHLCPTRVLRTDERASGVSASKLASLRTPLVRDFVASRRIRDGGGGGIRTHDTLL